MDKISSTRCEIDLLLEDAKIITGKTPNLYESYSERAERILKREKLAAQKELEKKKKESQRISPLLR